MALANGRDKAVERIKIMFGYNDISDGATKKKVLEMAEELVDAIIELTKNGSVDDGKIS